MSITTVRLSILHSSVLFTHCLITIFIILKISKPYPESFSLQAILRERLVPPFKDFYYTVIHVYKRNHLCIESRFVQHETSGYLILQRKLALNVIGCMFNVFLFCCWHIYERYEKFDDKIREMKTKAVLEWYANIIPAVRRPTRHYVTIQCRICVLISWRCPVKRRRTPKRKHLAIVIRNPWKLIVGLFISSKINRFFFGRTFLNKSKQRNKKKIIYKSGLNNCWF